VNRLSKLALVVAALILLPLAAGQLGLLSGQPPPDLGVRDGRLKPPSNTPNSVSSQAWLWPGPRDRAAQIEPLPATGDAPATMAQLRAIAESMPRTRIAESRDDYLRVEFSSRWMKFVDDAEFWFDPSTRAVQVRSASRLGRKDFGVNRERIEAIRARLKPAP
jgi:uncharacterized protein (DUF1499 family)